MRECAHVRVCGSPGAVTPWGHPVLGELHAPASAASSEFKAYNCVAWTCGAISDAYVDGTSICDTSLDTIRSQDLLSKHLSEHRTKKRKNPT